MWKNCSLKKNCNIMSNSKSKPIFGLNKMSDKELLRFSRQEVGKLKSYIDELKYDIGLLKKENAELLQENQQLKKLSKRERELLKRDEYIMTKDRELAEMKTQLTKIENMYNRLLSQSYSQHKEK